VPPFKVLIRGDDFPDTVPNQLFIEWIDGDGSLASDIHFLAARESIVPGTWYHVAFTLTASDAQLWVAADAGAYQLKDSLSGQDFAGSDGRVLVNDPTNFSVGRGMFNNSVTDWSNAFIDEVRVSDAALTPDQFLFLPPTNDADFDNDNDVDAVDFNTWAGTFGGAANGTTGDANGDGKSDGADFLLWQQQFKPPTVAAAVPEPGSMALAGAIGVLAVATGRKRK
jgi:hypothetical protein